MNDKRRLLQVEAVKVFDLRRLPEHKRDRTAQGNRDGSGEYEGLA